MSSPKILELINKEIFSAKMNRKIIKINSSWGVEKLLLDKVLVDSENIVLEK